MSLFKIFKGKAVNLPTDMHDGYAYFTTDDGKFYIDASVDGILKRTLINPTDDATGKVKSATVAEWAQQTSLISEKDVIYVYTDHQTDDGKNIPGIKIGDGLTYVVDLPFVDTIYMKHITDTDIHITAEERAKWNKVNSAVPNTRTVNGKALSSDISLGAGDVGAYTKSETDTKINAAVASAYKYKGSVTVDKLPTSGQVVGDVYNITNDSSYGKAGMNVAWNGTTWDALGSNVDLSNYVTTSDSRLSNARPASDVYAWAKAAKKPSYSASEISGLGSLATKNSLNAGDVGALPTSGGTMTGDIAFAATGTTGTSNKISFSGSTDGAQIYYNVPSSDQGNLIFNMTDDTNAYIQFAQNGTVHSYISPADGTYHGNISGSAGSVAWGNVSDKPSTYPPSSHTHTKDQVGLGNVANLDQSKAIKSITRNGTTFTATALDGTTSTFTQQDVNATYGLASSSSNGLMSAADKSKLDGIGAGSNVKSVNGKTGVVNLSKADVGLGNVDNTSDADKHVYANNLKWGGVNIANDISPLDVATSNLFAGNIMAYSKPAGITVEYSTDGGTTWADYGADDKSKIRLVTPEVGGVNYYLGKKNTAQVATMDLLRIELDARKMGIYCNPKNLLINISTNGGTGSYVNIEYSTRASDTVFHNFGKYNISGWSGWNSIPINNIPSGAFGTNGRDDQTVILRLTFGFTGFSKGWETKTSFSVRTMSMIASNRWGAPSEMARVNSIYHLDEYQNATFPAKVTATSFAGATATSSADGLMSKSDKSKLDGIGAGSNVKSVNSKTGAVTLTKSDIGLSNVDNTADSAKSVKYATSAGSANSVAWGNVSGRPSSLPANGGNSSTVNGHTVNADVPSGAKFTDTTYGAATQSSPGLMSAADKTKLDNLSSASTEGKEGVELTIPVSGWSSNTTAVNGTDYYTYSTTNITGISNPHPTIVCSSASGVLPSAEEKMAFDNISFVTVDTSSSKITFYAPTKPNSTVVLIVKDFTAENTSSASANLTIATSDWSSSTTSINGAKYYIAKKTVSGINQAHPPVICHTASSSAALPSKAEQTAYNCIDYTTVDTSTNIITFYATTKPSAAVALTMV